jgi:hypothetical protein
MKIFKLRVFYYNPSKNANFRLLQRHNMTKTRNKISAKISDFSEYFDDSVVKYFSAWSTEALCYEVVTAGVLHCIRQQASASPFDYPGLHIHVLCKDN